ncbi:hypothetical protein [Mameliella alba]
MPRSGRHVSRAKQARGQHRIPVASDLEPYMLDLINAARSAPGLAPLVL